MGTRTRLPRSSQHTLPQTSTAPRGMGTDAGLGGHGRQWPCLLLWAYAQSPQSMQQTLSQGGHGEEERTGRRADAQNTAEKGTDTTDVHRDRPKRPSAPHQCGQTAPKTWELPVGPLSTSSPGHPCMRGGLSLHVGRSLQPRVTPRATRGRRCLSTCSEDHKARQQRATPPCRARGRPRAAGSWRQARYLILPAGQAGRHKRRSREGRKDREEETDRRRDQKDGQTN